MYYINGVFGCKEKMIKEKKMRNRVDLCVVCYKRKRIEIEERSVDYF
jgi:hypothetical protein